MRPDGDLRSRMLADDIARVCARLYDRNFALGNAGNVSAKLSENEFLITPAGARLGDLTAESIVTVDIEGKPLDGAGAPSCELQMHLGIYKARPSVKAIVHAHPPYATGMAMARVGFGQAVHSEAQLVIGGIVLVEFGTPDTALQRILPHVADHNAFVLSNHGVITVGPSLRMAHVRLEFLEMLAQAITVAKIHGDVRRLSPEEQSAVERFKKGHEVIS